MHVCICQNLDIMGLEQVGENCDIDEDTRLTHPHSCFSFFAFTQYFVKKKPIHELPVRKEGTVSAFMKTQGRRGFSSYHFSFPASYSCSLRCLGKLRNKIIKKTRPGGGHIWGSSWVLSTRETLAVCRWTSQQRTTLNSFCQSRVRNIHLKKPSLHLGKMPTYIYATRQIAGWPSGASNAEYSRKLAAKTSLPSSVSSLPWPAHPPFPPEIPLSAGDLIDWEQHSRYRPAETNLRTLQPYGKEIT